MTDIEERMQEWIADPDRWHQRLVRKIPNPNYPWQPWTVLVPICIWTGGPVWRSHRFCSHAAALHFAHASPVDDVPDLRGESR